jgi:hypothetical protein
MIPRVTRRCQCGDALAGSRTRGEEMLRRRQLGLTAVVILVASSIGYTHAVPQQAPKPAPTNDRPLLEVDLHKFADANWDPNHIGKAEGTVRSEIDFAEGNSLLWVYVTRDNNFSPAKRNDPLPPSTGKLHAVLLDAATGDEKAKRDWSVPNVYGVRVAINDGTLLTCIDTKLQLFSPRFESLATREVPENNQCMNLRNLKASGPSEKKEIFFLSYGYGVSSHADFLDADTLEVTSTSKDNLADISDRWQIGFCGKPRQVCFRQADSAWQILKSPLASNQVSRGETRSVGFVNDNIAVIRSDREMEVVKMDSSTLFQVKLSRNRSYGRFVANELGVSSGGERFAVMEEKMEGIDSDFFDMGKFPSDDEIVVYDISERRAIFTLKVKGDSAWPPFVEHRNQFALSPDGNRLAVVSDGILRIYRLPDRSAVH